MQYASLFRGDWTPLGLVKEDEAAVCCAISLSELDISLYVTQTVSAFGFACFLPGIPA